MHEKPKLTLKRSSASVEEKQQHLVETEDVIEQGRNKAGIHSKPWQLVSPKEKRQQNLSLPATTLEKLEYVYRRHPANFNKSQLVSAALEPYLDALIAEIEQHG